MTEEVQTEVNPLSQMIDYITHSEYQKANEIFNELLGQKVNDSLEQEKIAVAQGIYKDDEDVEDSEDEDEEEFTEEEIEDALEDEEDEDFDEENE